MPTGVSGATGPVPLPAPTPFVSSEDPLYCRPGPACVKSAALGDGLFALPAAWACTVVAEELERVGVSVTPRILTGRITFQRYFNEAFPYSEVRDLEPFTRYQ